MKTMRTSLVLTPLLAVSLSVGPGAYAFGDVSDDPGKASIMALKELGVLSGLGNGRFAPEEPLTYAQSVRLMVKGFRMDAAWPESARDKLTNRFFQKIAPGAWYEKDFAVAYAAKLPLGPDIDPEGIITKEQFAELLYQTIMTERAYTFPPAFVLLADEGDVENAYMHSIQVLLGSGITALDLDRKFHPKQGITRSEAAVWLQNALVFTQKQKQIEAAAEQINIKKEFAAEGVNRVTLTRVEKSSMGYGISVENIWFQGNKAILQYQLHDPLPGRMYPALAVEVKTSVYVAEQYEIELQFVP